MKRHELEEENITEEPEIKIAPPLDVDNLGKAFAKFAERFIERRKMAVLALIKLLIPSLNGDTVIITLTRQQEELIGEIKVEWQAFLRSYFNNKTIVLQINIDEQATTKRKAYTQSEQFEEMLQENENFRQFVNRLKLKLKP